MALSIKNEEAYQLACGFAEVTGKSMTQVIIEALRMMRSQVKKQQQARHRTMAEKLDQIALHAAALPRKTAKTPEEVMRYDDHGLPQ